MPIAELLRGLLPDAIRVYQDALEGADKTVARDVLDRVLGKPSAGKDKPQTEGALPPLIVFEYADTEDD